MNETTQTAFSPAREQLSKEAQSRRSGARWALVAGLLMIGLGLLAVFSPLATGLSLAYLITAGLGVYGVAQIVAWFKTPAAERSAGSVVNGVLLTGFSLFTVWASVQTQFGFAGMIAGLAVAAAFLALLQGISQFFAFFQMRGEGVEGAGWMLATGIFNALVGVVILTNPLMSWFAISTVWSIYLCMSGVALTAESFAGRKQRSSAA